jgi:lipopolysaccharide biosynthesis glycosyltransferase
MLNIIEPLTIVMACDEGYAMPLATALRSIADSNSRHWPLRAYILYDSFSEQTKARVYNSLPRGSIALTWLHISLERFGNFNTLAHISNMTFARFLLADLLPQEVSRIVYLDSDLIVIGDLGDLWTSSLGENCAGAVLNYGLDQLLKRRDKQFAGLPIVTHYFNAGVLLIDIALWRLKRVGDRAAQYLDRHPYSPFADQDALNAVLNNEWTILAEKWNFQRHLEVNVARMKPDVRPHIIHFISESKPWKREYHTPNESLFDSFRSRTKFSRTLINRLVDSWKSTLFPVKQSLRRFARFFHHNGA